MANFGPAITCLTGTFAAYIAQESAKLMTRIASITASFTDPLQDLADTNVKQIADDVSNVASGNVAGALASIGSALIVNRVKRELGDILADIIKKNPGIGDRIQQITNISEAVYGIISLALLLRKEVPYSSVQLVIEDLEELLEQKRTNLEQLKKHIVQLNNCIMSTTDNPTNTAQLLADDFQRAVEKLDSAKDDLTYLLVDLLKSPSAFTQKHFDSAEANLEAAGDIINPGTDVNLLDLAQTVAPASVGTEFLTDAQIKVSAYAVLPIALMIQCEVDAIDKGTTRINNYLKQLPLIVPNYSEAANSDTLKSFRKKLTQQLLIRISQLSSDIKSALSKDDLGSIGIHSLSWSARIEAMIDMLPRIEQQLQVGSDDDERLQQMQAELALVLSELNDINGQNVTAAIEDTTALKAQITTLSQQARTIMNQMGSGTVQNFNIQTFQATVATVVSSGASAIDESLDTIDDIEDALKNFKTIPPLDQRVDDLIGLLELLGMDRAKDLLKIGKFTDFLNTTIDDASYLGLAIKCIIDVENLITDTATLSFLREIREGLQSQRLSELAAAFDILDAGKNTAILEIKNYLTEGQQNLERVKRVISELKRLASKAGEAVSDITEAAEGLGQELGEMSWIPGGPFNEYLSDLDIDGLQSGCLSQLKF